MLICIMRTTIQLDEHLLREVKKLAAERGTTFTAVVKDALRETLTRRVQPRRRSEHGFTTVDGRGLRAGVDLDNTAALLDLMESADGAR
jgi:Arc/MetJ family transcription regulator